MKRILLVSLLCVSSVANSSTWSTWRATGVRDFARGINCAAIASMNGDIQGSLKLILKAKARYAEVMGITPITADLYVTRKHSIEFMRANPKYIETMAEACKLPMPSNI